MFPGYTGITIVAYVLAKAGSKCSSIDEQRTKGRTIRIVRYVLVTNFAIT